MLNGDTVVAYTNYLVTVIPPGVDDYVTIGAWVAVIGMIATSIILGSRSKKLKASAAYYHNFSSRKAVGEIRRPFCQIRFSADAAERSDKQSPTRIFEPSDFLENHHQQISEGQFSRTLDNKIIK